MIEHSTADTALEFVSVGVTALWTVANLLMNTKVEKIKTAMVEMKSELLGLLSRNKREATEEATKLKNETVKAHADIKETISDHELQDETRFGGIATKLEGQNKTLEFQNKLLEKIDRKLDTKT